MRFMKLFRENVVRTDILFISDNLKESKWQKKSTDCRFINFKNLLYNQHFKYLPPEIKRKYKTTTIVVSSTFIYNILTCIKQI